MDLIIDHTHLQNRLFLGTASYPSLTIMQAAIQSANVEVITVSLKRQSAQNNEQNGFWEFIKAGPWRILPNTAGCRTAKEAIAIAQMAREIFNTRWIKLEVIGDPYTLQPHPFELVTACSELIKQDFYVFAYTTDDLVLCQKLVESGCQVLMPWGSPIGSGQGLLNPFALQTLRKRFSQIPLIIDAGIGSPKDAIQAMELGFDAVLTNSAVALASDPVTMATSFSLAVRAGRMAYLAGSMPKRNMAQSSTPLLDTPFWHQSGEYVA